MKKTATIETHASLILQRTDIKTVPVPIEKVAHRLGLKVEPATLGDDVSGVLVINDGEGTIGYNSLHPIVRQRFTIAHEIGHYRLHRNESQLFIDKYYFAAFRRVSKGEDILEREANTFAAALLMPRVILRKELEKQKFDLGDEEGLDALANHFQVSRQAMMYRLINLGIFTNMNS